MQRLEDADQTPLSDVKETKLPNHAEVTPTSTQETETQTDRKKEEKLPHAWGRRIGAFLDATFTDKWVKLIRKLLGCTAYLGISFVTIVLVEKGIFALMVLWEQNQTLLVIEDIGDTSTVIFYVLYLFVTMLALIKHLLDVFSL